MGEFMMVLLHAATNAHILHLRSEKYAEHQALAGFYEELPGLVDELVENIQGLTEELIEYPAMYWAPEVTGLEELRQLKDYVKANRGELPPDSEIQNDVDEICKLINRTIYKLRFLK